MTTARDTFNQIEYAKKTSREEGLVTGREEERNSIVLKMLQNNLPVQIICDVTGLSMEDVLSVYGRCPEVTERFIVRHPEVCNVIVSALRMTSKNGDDFLVLIYVVLTSGLLRLIFDLAPDMLCRSFMLETRRRLLRSANIAVV